MLDKILQLHAATAPKNLLHFRTIGSNSIARVVYAASFSIAFQTFVSQLSFDYRRELSIFFASLMPRSFPFALLNVDVFYPC